MSTDTQAEFALQQVAQLPVQQAAFACQSLHHLAAAIEDGAGRRGCCRWEGQLLQQGAQRNEKSGYRALNPRTALI